MKNLLLISFCFILSSGFTQDKIQNSKQINVVYMNFSEKGNYEDSDCFSNNKCKYSYMSLISIVDFDKEEVETNVVINSNYQSLIPNHMPISFKRWRELDETISIGTSIEIPYFDITFTNKKKDICGIECKNLIASYKKDSYQIWYFNPKKIKKNRINAYTGYSQMPGIILETSKGDTVTRKAIRVDNECVWE